MVNILFLIPVKIHKKKFENTFVKDVYEIKIDLKSKDETVVLKLDKVYEIKRNKILKRPQRTYK